VTKFARLPVERIKQSPYNPRHEALDIDALAAYRQGSIDLALAEAQKAVGYLENKSKTGAAA